MGTFNNSRFYAATPAAIQQVVGDVAAALVAEGYEVKTANLFSGGADISVTKGSLFKSIVGMRSALKVVVRPDANGIIAEASIGIFGQQIVPTLITMLVFWPVLITQIWGLVRQAKLDDHVLDLIGTFAGRHQFSQPSAATNATGSLFCTSCGSSMVQGSKFCGECGGRL